MEKIYNSIEDSLVSENEKHIELLKENSEILWKKLQEENLKEMDEWRLNFHNILINSKTITEFKRKVEIMIEESSQCGAKVFTDTFNVNTIKKPIIDEELLKKIDWKEFNSDFQSKKAQLGINDMRNTDSWKYNFENL